VVVGIAADTEVDDIEVVDIDVIVGIVV